MITFESKYVWKPTGTILKHIDWWSHEKNKFENSLISRFRVNFEVELPLVIIFWLSVVEASESSKPL